ncbi:hypothetical protein VB735_13895 [Halotia wernerae UHCC 0503]|nr:hypothetical protein [Halotia wernerae UHCC 0503]
MSSFSQKIQKITLAKVNQAAHELPNPGKIVVVTADPTVVADQSIR